MTISISKTSLLLKLQQLSKIIPSKSSTPVLCNYLFEAKDGRLFITAANEEGRIMTSLECICDDDFSICVPTSIVEGLKSLPEQPLNIYVDPENKAILIKYHGGKFEIVGYDPKLYPVKRKIEILDEINTTAKELGSGISKVVNFSAEDDLRPIMTSVLIETSPGYITFVASDGHGLGFLKKENKLCRSNLSVVISRQTASILKNIIPLSEDELNIKVGGDWSTIVFADYEISFRNVEGRYPNWKVVVPKSNDKLLCVDTKQLLGAIKRTSVFSNKATCLIILKMVYGKLTVSAQDFDFSTFAEEILDVEFDSNQFTIGVKGPLLQAMLSCIDNERSILSFSDPSRAILIVPEAQSVGEELTYLLMPMTIQ